MIDRVRKGALMFSRKNGFTFLEFALLLTVVIAALLAMQIFMKRSLMAKWKNAADSIGFGRQY